MERIILILAVVALCVVLSFLFSGMEAGVLALSRVRIRQLMRSGNRNASALLNHLESPENFLWTILVGNTVANFAVVSLVAVVEAATKVNVPSALLGKTFALLEQGELLVDRAAASPRTA